VVYIHFNDEKNLSVGRDLVLHRWPSWVTAELSASCISERLQLLCASRQCQPSANDLHDVILPPRDRRLRMTATEATARQ